MLHVGSSEDASMCLFPLVYDTSSRETFEKLEEWLNEVEMYSTKKDIIKMLVGNKIDKVSFPFQNGGLVIALFPCTLRGASFRWETRHRLSGCVAGLWTISC